MAEGPYHRLPPDVPDQQSEPTGPEPGVRPEWSSLPPPPSGPGVPVHTSGVGHGKTADKAAEISRALSTVCAVGAFAVILATLTFRHEVPFVAIGLVIVVPAIVFGQWRMILSGVGQKKRRELRSPRTAQQRRWPRSSSGFSNEDLFGGLTRRQRRLVFALAAFGWIAALPGMVLAPTPHTTPSSCEATLTEHGETRCVDQDDLDRYQAGVQRFAAGIVLGFCIVHAAAAHSDLRRRGQTNGDGPEGDPDRPRGVS